MSRIATKCATLVVLCIAFGPSAFAAAPSISSLSPTSGTVGTSVTVSGSNFGSSQGSSTVKFNGITATPTSWSTKQIVAPVPSAATTGNIVVTVGSSSSNGVSFTVRPAISSLSPVSGAIGASITIGGTGFGTTQGTSTVKFNGTTATPTSWSATSIAVSVPPGATTGNVVVTVNSVASSGVSFSVLPAPSISGLSSASGAIGALITITGTNFGSTQGLSTVSFNGAAGTPTSWSATSISIPVPTGATTGNVLVHASGVNSNSVSFTVGPAPAITSLSPTSGPVGTSVTITGTAFGSTQGTVTFGGRVATPTSWSATSIVTPVPVGGFGASPVVVYASGVSSNSSPFTITPPPHITNLSSGSGPIGSFVIVFGTNFGSAQGTTTVTFNGTAATPVPGEWSDTSIEVSVPTGATTGNVVVTRGGSASNGMLFTIADPPYITSFSPASGAVGTSVTITGTNFGSDQGTSTVTFNGTATAPTGWSNTSIVVPVPSGATTGNVVVTVSGLSNIGGSFTVIPPPSITSISPSSAVIGTSVTVTGTNFGATQDTSSVTFNGTAATPNSWTATSIVVPVPSGATTGNVIVTVSGQTSTGVSFTVIPSPSITSLSPTSGVVGASVTIAGTNFGSTQGASTVTFNGTAATPTSWSATSIVVPVPSGATTGNVVVTVNGQASAGASFTVIPPPSVTSISPSSAVTGASLTISGTNFGGTQGASSVTFNGTSATPTSWSATSIVVPVPSGATTGNVVVTVSGQASAGTSFTVLSLPSITSISPTSGPIGTQITITGTGFGSSAGTATVNGTSATIQGWSDTQVLATVIAGTTSGGVQVINGGVSSNTIAFTISSSAAFVRAGNANTTRLLHTATLLNNGQVLLAGGINNGVFAPVSSSDLYDPASGNFNTTGSLNTPRYLHTATLLNDGTVLIAGGDGSGGYLSSVELYNPVAGIFTPITSMTTQRLNHTATLLQNGSVLMAGGNGGSGPSAELYNPATGTFVVTGSMTTDRSYHSATLLNNGMVLLVGGYGADGNTTATAELYNPTTGIFTPTGNLNNARNSHTATLLNKGIVLIAGGYDNEGNVLTTAELYDPSTGIFTATGSPITPRAAYAAALLNNGSVLFVGGYDDNFNDLASAEIYDPAARVFTATSSESIARDSHTATLLGNGAVLIAGGRNSYGYALAAAELYQPATLVPPGLVSIEVSPSNSTTGVAMSERFTAVGTFSDGNTQTLSSVTWLSSDNSIATITNDASNQGNSFALAPGSATLTACAGSICGTASITVISSSLNSIAVAPIIQTSFIDTKIQFRAIGTFADGGTEDLTASVIWNSSSPAIASISSSGLASTFIKGTTNITASLNGVTGSNPLTVVLPLSDIDIIPQNGFVAQGATQQFTAIGTYTDGSTADVTSSVTWSSAQNAVASISSAGLVTGLSFGTTTITATLSGIGSSATLNITAQLASIAINPSNSSIPFGLSEVLTATGTFSDGSTQDLTGDVTWNSSSSSVATVNAAGSVTPVAQGSTTITARYAGIAGSTSLSVAAPILITAVLSPQNSVLPGGVNQQFTAMGTFSDGTTQDVTTLVAWSSGNSSIAGISASGVVTTVSSGTTTVSVSLNGFVFSTNLTVSAAGPPTIVASISPSPNNAGWNNSAVTVTFTCTPGSAAITSCPASQVVSSEGANQVVSGTVTDASGTTATANVSLNIDTTPPVLSVVSPTDGEIFSVSTISSTGTVSDTLSGLATLTCNGTTISNNGGSFSCNIPMNPGVNLVVVRAVDIAGNVALAKMHVNDTLPLPPPNSLQITPSQVNLIVGETRQFSVVDELGHPRTDVTWTVSDSSIATITSVNNPVLTAVSTGVVRLTATVQGLMTSLQLNITTVALSPGTAVWTTQGISGMLGVLPAVPSGDGGPGFYSVQSTPNLNSLLAFTSDGQLLWQHPSSQIAYPPLPDGQGGIVVQMSQGFSTTSLTDLDNLTGSPVWQNTTENFFSNVLAVRPDGGIVALESTPGGPQVTNTQVWLDVFGGNTGQRIVHYLLPQSVETTRTFSCSGTMTQEMTVKAGPFTTPISIDAAGNIYMGYSLVDDGVDTTRRTNCNPNPPSYTEIRTRVGTEKSFLLTVPSSGSASSQQLKSDFGSEYVTSLFAGPEGAGTPISTTCSTSGSSNSANQVIPDGQGGVLAAWTEVPNEGCSATGPVLPTMITHMGAQGSQTYSLPIGDPPQFVLGENGVAYTMGDSSGVPAPDSFKRAIAFDMNSGEPLWTYDAPPHKSLDLVASTDDGGLLATQSTNSTDVIHFDSQGTPARLATIPFLQRPLAHSWSGQWYGSFSGGRDVELKLPVGIDMVSLWQAAGNPSGQKSEGRPWFFRMTWQNEFDFIPDVPNSLPNLKTDITYDAATIKHAALDALKKAYSSWPVTVFEGLSGGDHRALISTTTTGQGPSCGFTDPNIVPPQSSTVAYECNMQEAQQALQIVIRNAQEEMAALQNSNLIQAIGRGIGATAAHEIAHQFLGECCSMDVLIRDDSKAAGTYNNGDADASPLPQVVDSDPSPYTGYWKDGTTAIHWEATTKSALSKCLIPGWKDYGLVNCAVKLQLSLNYPGFISTGDDLARVWLPNKYLDGFIQQDRRRSLTLKSIFFQGSLHR